jgi:hypothetical protein
VRGERRSSSPQGPAWLPPSPPSGAGGQLRPRGLDRVAASSERVGHRAFYGPARRRTSGPVLSMLDVLGSAPDPGQHLKRVRPMLDPEGTFVLPTMMADSPVRVDRMLASSQELATASLPLPFRSRCRAGFRVVEWLLPSRLRCVEAQSRLRPQAVVGFRRRNGSPTTEPSSLGLGELLTECRGGVATARGWTRSVEGRGCGVD